MLLHVFLSLLQLERESFKRRSTKEVVFFTSHTITHLFCLSGLHSYFELEEWKADPNHRHSATLRRQGYTGWFSFPKLSIYPHYINLYVAKLGTAGIFLRNYIIKSKGREREK